MTVGTHGSTFGGNPLATRVGNAVLDVVLAPGFLDRTRRMALLLKQRLAEMKDRHPAVIADVRGEGLLIGLRCNVPNGDVVAALRNEKLLTVAAGDNVVRLLPPLIVSEADIAEAIGMIDRACTTLSPCSEAASARLQSDGQTQHPPFHRSDRCSVRRPARDHRGCARDEEDRKARGKRPLAGQTLAMIFDKPSTRTRISFEVAMMQLGGDVVTLTGQEMQLGRGEIHRRHRAGDVALRRLR